MVIAANTGPTINYGVTLSSSGATGEYNEQRGPSICDLGEGLMDPRPQFAYQPGQGVSAQIMAWAGLFGGPVVDYIPSQASTAALSSGITLSATTTFIAGSVIPLSTTSTSANLTKLTGFVPSSNPSSSGLTVFAIDNVNNSSLPRANAQQLCGKAFGSAGSITLWDPNCIAGRCPTVVSTIAGDTGVVTFAGFDSYGFAMTLQSTVVANGTFTSQKAFKFLQTMTITTLGTSKVWTGLSDNYGFPIRVDNPGYLTAWWGNSTGTAPNAGIVNVVSTTTHVFGVEFISVVQSSNGAADVRGTLNAASTSFTNSVGASNGTTNRLQFFISPSVGNVATVGTSIINGSSGTTVGTSNYTGPYGTTPALNFSGLVGVPQI